MCAGGPVWTSGAAGARNSALEIHLLSVQSRFKRHLTQFRNRTDLETFYRQEGEKKLARAWQFLDRHGTPYTAHVKAGDKATTIASMAKRLARDHIVIGTARKNSLTRMCEALLTNQVLELAPVPVDVIPGDAISNLERYGIPAGIGAELAPRLATAD